MIKKIGLQNFRVFKDAQFFDFKKINILTGANNCGKSAIQKFLFLLKESYLNDQTNSSFEKLIFNSETIRKIDLFENNLNYKSESDEMVFTFKLYTKFWGEVDVNLIYKKSLFNENGILQLIEIEKDSKKIFGFANRQLTPSEKKEIESRVEDRTLRDLNVEGEEHQNQAKEPENWWENVRGWYPKIDLTDEILNRFYELLMSDKANYLECKFIFDFNKKETLTKTEEHLKAQLEEKGFLFNDDRARNEIENDNNDDFLNFMRLYVWDTQKGRACRSDDVSAIFNFLYYDESLEVFIPTLLSYVVLGTPFFFEGKEVEQKALKIRELLYQQGIDSKEAFLKEYKKFELGIIKQSLFSLDYFKSFFSKDLEARHDGEFNKYFYSKSNLMDNIVENGSEKILNIFKSDGYNNLNFQSENIYYNTLGESREFPEFSYFHPFERKVPETSDEDFENIVKIAARIRNLPRNPIALLNNQLKNLMLNCSIAFESADIKKYYFYNLAEPEDKLFLDFASAYDEQEENDTYNFCNHWLKEFDIADELKVKPVMVDKKTVGVCFWISKDGDDYPIGDNGVGVNHVIQLIIRIAVQPEKSLLLIEEPEANLHPAFQSKLAELVADAVHRFQTKFIIETHSEYFIRKFQYLIASPSHNVKAHDISISYLYHPDKIPEGKKQVERLSINEDGSLDGEFGSGFFDEATNWQVELMRIKHAQRN